MHRQQHLPRPPARGTTRRPTPQRIKWDAPQPTGELHECEELNGDFIGVMTHMRESRRQTVALRLVSFPTQTGTALRHCVVTGTAQLYFASGERISIPVPTIEVDPAAAEFTLPSDAYTDLAVQFRITGGRRLQGLWYSRLFGLVGTFEAVRGAPLPVITGPDAVWGPTGNFQEQANPRWSLNLSTLDASFDKSSHDPFVLYGGCFSTCSP